MVRWFKLAADLPTALWIRKHMCYIAYKKHKTVLFGNCYDWYYKTTARGNSHSLSRTNLWSQTMSTQKITSSTGWRRQLSAGNLIGQQGGSERLSKTGRKPKTSWTETRGSSCSPMSTTTYYSPLRQLQRLLVDSYQFKKGDSCWRNVTNFR